MTRGLALAGVAIGLSLVGYAVFARETDQEAIFRVLTRLEKAVHVDGDTAKNPRYRALQLRGEFADVFDKNVSYRIPELSAPSESAESLVALAVRNSVSLTTLDVTFSAVDVQIIPPGTSARTNSVAKVQAFRGSEPYEQSERRVHFELSKSSGSWRITSFSVDVKD